MMNSTKDIIKDKYFVNSKKLEKDFDEAYEQNETFKKIVNSLKLDKQELMKYTTKLEDSARELDHCKNCKNILECKNVIEGYVYYPTIEQDNIVFSYIPCKYKKNLDKQNSYKENVYIENMPRTIKNASMKDIYTDDKNRFEVIKKIKEIIDNYDKDKATKGIYLTGNFGCGKTYLLSAMLNELAKKGNKIAIVYYPEFLRSLKESFNNDEEYTTRFNYIKKVDLLLLDDIGAETMTPWARDEILGTILQYRMEEGLTTFFTSNLTIKELEEHLSISNKGVEKVKARRIIERIKQLSIEIIMISDNKRKEGI